MILYRLIGIAAVIFANINTYEKSVLLSDMLRQNIQPTADDMTRYWMLVVITVAIDIAAIVMLAAPKRPQYDRA